MEKQKILVYGAGVLGSLLAARLQDSGHEVSVLARGQRLADLREHGIVLEEDESGQRSVTRVNVVEALGPDDVYDLALVVLQQQQTEAVLPALAANRHIPDILFLQNNPYGPESLTRALGMERVLMGFPASGGTREGHVVRYTLAGKEKPKVVFGEAAGPITARAQRVAAVLESGGLAVELRADMDDWLKHHAAVVAPAALAIYAAAGDNHRLARTRDGLVMTIRAVREGCYALEALGYPVTPVGIKHLLRLPEPLLVTFLARVLDSKLGETGMARHANTAREEMRQLAEAALAFGRQAAVPMPYLQHLYTYAQPDTPPLPDGSRSIPLDWSRALPLLAGLLALLALFGLSRRRSCG